MTTREIKIYKDSRNLALGNMQDLGVERDNKVIKLKFIFDEFVDGEAELLTNIKGSDGNLLPFKLTKNVEDKSYELIVEDYMLVNNRLTFQLQIVCIDNVVWHSKQSELSVNECLVVGEGEMPDIVSNWLISADLKLVEIDEKETQISLAEKDRVQSEQERVNNENSRINSENNRIVEEQVREENEEIRSLNETQRETNEQKRISNESERVEYINNLKKDVEEGKFDGKDGVDGKDYILTEEDENNIADKVEVKIEPKLASNLRESKEYTDNSNLFDIKDVSYDEDSAVLTFTRHDDTKIIIDLPLEIALKDGYYDDSTKELVLVLMNNQEIRIPASGLIDDYSTEDSVTIQLNISADNVITASIKGQSISKTLLTLELQEEINNKVNKTDYATHLSGGVIKVNSNDSGIYINESGFLKATKFTLSNYNQKKASIFVSKGTLDEVLEPIKNDIINNTEDIKDNTNRIRRLESDIFDSGEASGDVIHIEDSTLAEAIEIEADGSLKQETTKGYQLYNVNDLYTKDKDFSVDSKGWITLNKSSNDTKSDIYPNYWVKANKRLKTNTDYILIVEIKEVNIVKGDPTLVPVSFNASNNRGQFTSSQSTRFSVLKTNDKFKYNIRTLESFDDSVSMLRTFITYHKGDEGSITFRLSLLEDTSIAPETFVYEEYTGGEPSPNLDYPQDIEVIESGDYNIYSCGNNFISTSKDDWESGHYSPEGIKVPFETRMRLKELIPISPKQKLIPLNYLFLIRGYDRNKKFLVDLSIKNANFEFEIPDDVYFLGISVDCKYDEYDEVKPPILKSALSTSDDSNYNLSKLIMPVPDEEFKAKLTEEIKDKHYIKFNEEDGQYHLYFEKNVGRYRVTGTENNWSIEKDLNGAYTRFRLYISSAINVNSRLPIKSDFFSYLPTGHKKDGAFLFDSMIYVYMSDEIDTLEKCILWMKEHKPTFYYPARNTYILDQGIVDMPLTYNKITNVYSDFPLNSTLHLKYYRNFKETIYSLQNSNELANSKIAKIETDIADLQNKINQLMPSTISEEVYNEDLL